MESKEVVATSTKDSIIHKIPFSISVSIDITPPETATFPTVSSVALSKNGLNRPTAHTMGRTNLSL